MRACDAGLQAACPKCLSWCGAALVVDVFGVFALGCTLRLTFAWHRFQRIDWLIQRFGGNSGQGG